MPPKRQCVASFSRDAPEKRGTGMEQPLRPALTKQEMEPDYTG